jgi:type IV fimbrial biogenesis protein FimT
MAPHLHPHPRSPRPRHHAAARGASLLEALVVLAIVAVLLGAALPSLGGLAQRTHLEGVALQFETDVQHARSLAVARQQGVRIGFGQSGGRSCYLLHTGAPGGCTCTAPGPAVCAGGAEALRLVRIDGRQAPALHANAASVLFDPVRGTTTPTATVRVVAADGRAIHQVVNIMGRVRSCSPGGAVAGYRAC